MFFFISNGSNCILACCVHLQGDGGSIYNCNLLYLLPFQESVPCLFYVKTRLMSVFISIFFILRTQSSFGLSGSKYPHSCVCYYFRPNPPSQWLGVCLGTFGGFLGGGGWMSIKPFSLSLSFSMFLSLPSPSPLAKLELGLPQNIPPVGAGTTGERCSCSVSHERQRSQTLRKVCPNLFVFTHQDLYWDQLFLFQTVQIAFVRRWTTFSEAAPVFVGSVRFPGARL